MSRTTAPSLITSAGRWVRKAAARLGVHRNTVALRLEWIKAAGFDVDEPRTRLALHLAARVLLP